MTRFEDHLWQEVVREHGADLEVSGSSPKRHRWARPRLIIATSLGMAGAGAALALFLGLTTASPAFAITRHSNGTVTISIAGDKGIAGANAELEEYGIRAVVLASPQVPSECTTSTLATGDRVSTASLPPSGGAAASQTWTITPSRIPAGRTLALADAAAASANSGTERTHELVWICPAELIRD